MKKVFAFYILVAACVAGAADRAAVDGAVEKGMKFLLSAQQADGHFSDAGTPALTALPLWAMAATGKTDGEAAKKAVAFVLASQHADGGFYAKMPARPGMKGNGTGGPGGLSTYNTAVCLSALYESGLAPKEPMLKARTFLAESQLGGDDAMAGGFGYGKAGGPRRYADLSNTSYALDALHRTAKLEEFRADGTRKADADWDKAIAFVTGLQEQEGERKGGAAYNERTPQAGTSTNKTGRVTLMSYGSMSYAAVMSLSYAKLTRADPRVKSALEYCAKYWTVDENPGMGSQGLYYYYDILTRALEAAKVDEVGTHVWRAELADKLLSLQKPDGSWANENNRFWEGDPVLATSFAILALSICR